MLKNKLISISDFLAKKILRQKAEKGESREELFATLFLEVTADEDDIRKTKRVLDKLFHPDKSFLPTSFLPKQSSTANFK